MLLLGITTLNGIHTLVENLTEFTSRLGCAQIHQAGMLTATIGFANSRVGRLNRLHDRILERRQLLVKNIDRSCLLCMYFIKIGIAHNLTGFILRRS